jgi:hypothetical protein
LDQKFVMGYGGRAGRGGSTSSQEGIEKSKEKKENKPSGVKISAEEIRKVVVKFLKDLSGNTNPKKVPRLLNRLSEETIRALSFMRTLKYVTDKELIAKYIAAEAKREEWFNDEGWAFTPDVKPDELPLLTYGTVARCYGKTVYPSETDDAFFEFINTPEGPLRTAEYDKVLCTRLNEAFGKKTINSTLKKYEAVTLQVHGPDEILDDVISFVGTISTIDYELGELDADEMEQVIEVLNGVVSKSASELGVGMTTATKSKGYSVGWWCELLVDKATLRMEATDEFDAWQKKSKGPQPMSEAERLELINSKKKIAQLEKEIAQLKASKQNGPSTRTAAVSNKGCFNCGEEGHRANRCPTNKPTNPATPKQASAKQAGPSGKKVSYTQLEMDSAVKEAARAGAQEAVKAMAKQDKQP